MKCPTCGAESFADRCGCGANLRAIRAENDANELAKQAADAQEKLQALERRLDVQMQTIADLASFAIWMTRHGDWASLWREWRATTKERRNNA